MAPDTAAPSSIPSAEAALALLEWQVAMGADEAIGETAPDRLAPPPVAAALRPAAIPAAVPSRANAAAPSLVAPPGALAEFAGRRR